MMRIIGCLTRANNRSIELQNSQTVKKKLTSLQKSATAFLESRQRSDGHTFLVKYQLDGTGFIHVDYHIPAIRQPAKQ